MDRTEAAILQHLYWTDIRYAVWKESMIYDTGQRTKQSNKNMVNYRLRKLRKYHGKNMCISNWVLRHTYIGTHKKNYI